MNVQYFWLLAAFSNSSFYGKISSPAKNWYLPTFLDDKAEILAACLSKFYWALFCLILLLIVLIGSFQLVMDPLMVKMYSSLKIKIAFSYNLCKAW